MWAFAYTDGNGYGNSCSIGHADSNGNSYSNCYSDADAYCIANAKEYGHTTAASYTASSTVSLGVTCSFLRELAKQFASSRKAIEPIS